MKIVISKICCPIDFSDNSEHALKYAIAFAQAHNAALHLLHVVDIPVFASLDYPIMPHDIADIAKNAQRKIDDILMETKQLHERVTTKVIMGKPFMEIIQYARTEEVDLIVLGTHGSSGIAHALMGSVAERVVRKAPCPVLTIKHPEHEFIMP